MFVAGLLEDWMRRLEEGRQRRRELEFRNSPQRYQAFLESQKETWTPPELFDKCCPNFLAGGEREEEFHTIRRKDGSYSCRGGCHKAHPTITLFFDANKSQTIAILSHRLDPFLQYLQHRVDEGTAVCKTPYYYELKGFVRENVNHAKEHHNLFGGHLVKVALGAVSESDWMQQRVLETKHRESRQHRHSTSRPNQVDAEYLLEKVLNICRMHRLGDDLDVLSIHAMQHTSRAFQRVAVPMAQQRLNDVELVVTPMVDGFFVAGYSVFRRSDTTRQTVMERDQGRMVEYAVASPPIVCRVPKKKKRHPSSNRENSGQVTAEYTGRFVPCSAKEVGNVNNASTDGLGAFGWGCQELSFANLEREWGDIGATEYVGQRAMIFWRRNTADMVDTSIGTYTANHAVDDPHMWPIFDLRISNAAQKPGLVTFSAPGFSVLLDLTKTTTTQVNDVTVSFEGSATVVSCTAGFDFLVKAYARSLQPLLRSRQEQLLKTRPLLTHEQDLLRRVKTLSCAGHRH